MSRSIALLRGVNVGRARRIAMADLRELLTGLGHDNVATLLNSGNVVFDARGPGGAQLERDLARGLERIVGSAVPLAMLTSARLERVIRDNPLAGVITDPARFLVAFACEPGGLGPAQALAGTSWKSERFALGPDAAYLWCSRGILDSPLMKAFTRATGAGVTARNWQTLLRLQALARAPTASARRSRS